MKEAVRIVSQSGDFVILNDLTNVLRHADLTVIRENDFSFYEVKGGTKDRRAVRQAHRLDGVLDMLNNRSHSIGDQTAQVFYIDSAPANLFDNAKLVIDGSLDAGDGISSSKIAPYLWLSCISVNNLMEHVRANNPWPNFPSNPFSKSRFFPPFGNLTAFDIYSPNLAPFSVFSINEQTAVRLMLGKMHIKVCIGEKELVHSFAGKGWRLEFPSEPLWNERLNASGLEDRVAATRNPYYYPRLSRGIFATDIPWDLLYRIGLEFLSVKSIVAIAEGAMKNIPPGESRYIVSEFRNEGNRWV